MSRENGMSPQESERKNGSGTDLEPRQWIALRARLVGKTVTEAAEAAGVHRSTLHRWHQEDPEFRATYNQLRRAQQEAFRQRLMELATQAVETVGRAVAAGDIDRSFRLLEGLGLLDGRAADFGPTCAAEIKQQVFLQALELRTGPGGNQHGR